MLNRIVLIGRLTRDPEAKYTQTGVPVATFGIAVDRPVRNAETGERETDFINIVAWRKNAEFVTQYLTKGRLVSVDGRLQIRQWTAQDGTKRTTAEVVADNVQGLDRPKDGAPAPAAAGAEPSAPPPTADTEADPFGDE
jgi:single-strand DNA-binding protein